MKTFEQLGVHKSFVKGLKEMNIVQPTEIQSEAIPLLINNNTDLVGQAQTGTGKTAAFGLPVLQKINPGNSAIQALILCPTRELGQQIYKQLFKYTKYSEKIFIEAVYGGAPIDRQIKALRRTTHVVVATPGRLIDLLGKKALDLSQVKTVVMDEADEMLSLGFKKELDKILSSLSSARNKWLFSATMPVGIKEIVANHLSPKAERISIGGRNTVNKNIKHQYLICDEEDKFLILLQMLRYQHKSRGVIFCKTKATTKKLTALLKEKEVAADAIHGDLLQKERDKVMRAFKNKSLQILVATDLAARGLDIEALAYVVHYELPDSEEYYTHRSGRTARAGLEGISLSIITTADLKQIRYFQKKLNISFSQIRPVK